VHARLKAQIECFFTEPGHSPVGNGSCDIEQIHGIKGDLKSVGDVTGFGVPEKRAICSRYVQ
jgi:hypothetical protein